MTSAAGDIFTQDVPAAGEAIYPDRIARRGLNAMSSLDLDITDLADMVSTRAESRYGAWRKRRGSLSGREVLPTQTQAGIFR